MIKAVWFIIKIILLALVAMYLSRVTGKVTLEWMDYSLKIHTGFFVFLLIATIWASMTLQKIIDKLISLKSDYKRYRYKKTQRSGYKHLLKGFVSLASGNPSQALVDVDNAKRLLDGDDGLILMIEAQAAKMNNDEPRFIKAIQSLSEHDELAFIGIKGMINNAAESGEIQKALELTNNLGKSQKKQPGIIKMLYDLHTKNENWEQALEILKTMERSGILPVEKIKNDRAVILVAVAEKNLENGKENDAVSKLKKALDINEDLIPAISLLARIYANQGKAGKAVKLLEKSWKTVQHPELTNIWKELSPKNPKKPLSELKWAERLLSVDPNSYDALIYTAETAMQLRLWGEAREHLEQAEKIDPTSKIYKLFAEIEKRSEHNLEKAEYWQSKATDAKPEKIWLCSQSGRIYSRWSAIALPQRSFNTIYWGYPDQSDKNLDLISYPEEYPALSANEHLITDN